MPTWEVRVAGTSVEQLIDVQPTEESEDQLGVTKVVMGNTPSNRQIESGNVAEVFKNGSSEFEGYVISNPSRSNSNGVNDILELSVADRRYELKNLTVSRPFYQMDPGEILREAITKRIRPLSRRFIYSGDSLSGWSSDTSEFQLTEFSSGGYKNYGHSMIFAGLVKGSSGQYDITYSDVPDEAIPGAGQISELVTRFLVSLPVGSYKMEIGLQDNGGNLYVWEVDNPRSDFEEYTFSAELAEPGRSLITEGDLNNGELQYSLRLDGDLDSNRGIAFDAAYTKPFALSNRNSEIGVDGIQNSGRSITRRFDLSVFEILSTLVTEDQATSYVDSDNVLHFEPAGQTTSPRTIDYTSTPVVEVDIDRDYDRVRNTVTVIGNEEKGIQVNVSDEASIEYYGIEERGDDIKDHTIVSEERAIERGEGFLADRAWDDTPMQFVIADTDYSDVRVGESIEVNWPSEDITGTFVVSMVETDADGFVTIGVTGSGA